MKIVFSFFVFFLFLFSLWSLLQFLPSDDSGGGCNGVRYHHRLFIWRADFCLLLIFKLNFFFTFAGFNCRRDVELSVVDCIRISDSAHGQYHETEPLSESSQSTVTSWDSLISPLWGHVWIDGLSSIVMHGWTAMTSRAWIDSIPWLSPCIHAMSSLSHSSFVFVLDSSLLSSIVVR